MFLTIKDISTGTLIEEPLNIYTINFVYVKEETVNDTIEYRLIYVLDNGIIKIEAYQSREEVDAKLADLGNVSVGGLIQENSYKDFPEIGNASTIYIAKDTGQMYFYDDVLKNYEKIGVSRKGGVYSYNGVIQSTIGAVTTLNKDDLTELVKPSVAFMDGSEVIGNNSVRGVITESTETTVTIRTITDLVIESFVQVPTEADLPTNGAVNVLYFVKELEAFRVWNADSASYVEIKSGGQAVTYVTSNSSTNPFMLDKATPGIYQFTTGNPYIQKDATKPAMNLNIADARLYILQTVSADTPNDTALATYIDSYDFLGDMGRIMTLKTTTSNNWGLINSRTDVRNIKQFMFTTGNQSISGVKTFTELPESRVVPTDNAHLVNKAYVDNQIANNSGAKVIWLNINNITDYFELENGKYYTYVNELPKRTIFMFDRYLSYNSSYLSGNKLYARPDREHKSGAASLVFNSNAMCFWIDEFTEDSNYYENSVNVLSPGEIYPRTCYYFYVSNWQNRNGDAIVDRDTAQEIKGLKTFTALPKSTIVPTDNAHLVNKAYVDSKVVDNLTTADASLSLSANQGKILNEKITTLSAQLGDIESILATLTTPPTITSVSESLDNIVTVEEVA